MGGVGGPVGGLIKITMDSDFWGCLGVAVDGEADRSAGVAWGGGGPASATHPQRPGKLVEA